MKMSTAIIGGVFASSVGLTGCTTPAPTLPYPPGLQTFVVDGAVATMVAQTCPDLTRNEDAVNALVDAFVESGIADGYTPQDLSYFIQHTDKGQVADLMWQRFDRAGLPLPTLDTAAQSDAFFDELCAYGMNEKSKGTPVGKILL